MEEVPIEQSQAIAYVQSKGWSYTFANNDKEIVFDCPSCGKEKHLYMNVDSTCFNCKVCGQSGNLKTMRKLLGDPIPGVTSLQETVKEPVKPLPNIEIMHTCLLNDQEAMDYLICERGFTFDVIDRMKLGLGIGDKRWLVFPYVNASKYVYAKMRTLPPLKKEFKGSGGRENPLYHADAIRTDAEELIFVEGEGDCLALMSQDYEGVVGIPGASMKKATWIERLDVWWEDRAGKERRLYLLYDNDKAGVENCADMAKRIGIEKCLIITLPGFDKKDGTPGKDINEWFSAGHTKEEFEEMKKSAKPLDVKGVMGLGSALDQLEADIDNRGGVLSSTIDTPWDNLNPILGGAEYGDVVGVIAEGKIGKTTFGMNWVNYLVDVKHITSMILCFEMPQKRIARKWASYVTQTDDTPGKSLFTKATIQGARDKLASMDTDLLLAYTSAQDAEKVFDLIKQAVRRYAVKVVMLDNLQMMVRSIQHAAQETSVLSKRIKDLATELGIMIILIVQPKRVESNEIVAARHSMGSAAIEKDCDSMICLHRNRIGVIKADEFEGLVEQEVNFSSFMLVRVDLSRYSAGGACTLYMEGGTSTVRELVLADRATPEKVQSIGPEIPIEQAKEL